MKMDVHPGPENEDHPERAYRELLKRLKGLQLRGAFEVTATKPFRPLTTFITDLPPQPVIRYEDVLPLRCLRAIDRARELCETANQILRKMRPERDEDNGVPAT
jgi:hypothetical protein